MLPLKLKARARSRLEGPGRGGKPVPRLVAARQILTDARRVDHDARALSRDALSAGSWLDKRGKARTRIEQARASQSRGHRWSAVRFRYPEMECTLMVGTKRRLVNQINRSEHSVVALVLLIVWQVTSRPSMSCQPVMKPRLFWPALAAGFPKGTAKLGAIGRRPWAGRPGYSSAS
jgi:hypothetical protein